MDENCESILTKLRSSVDGNEICAECSRQGICLYKSSICNSLFKTIIVSYTFDLTLSQLLKLKLNFFKYISS